MSPCVLIKETSLINLIKYIDIDSFNNLVNNRDNKKETELKCYERFDNFIFPLAKKPALSFTQHTDLENTLLLMQ